MDSQTSLTPEWLRRRGGEVRGAEATDEWIVFFDGKQQYLLSVVPVKGKFGGKVMQSINGKLIPVEGVHDSAEGAQRAGLEALRGALGW